MGSCKGPGPASAGRPPGVGMGVGEALRPTLQSRSFARVPNGPG